MQRITTFIFLALTACRPSVDATTDVTTTDTDVFFERALELDRQHVLHNPPTFAAAQAHALELAQIARDANDAPVGVKYPYAARRLAVIADLVRNELLACRAPLWELRRPAHGVNLSSHPWFVEHHNELRRGATDGWTTSKLAVDAEIARIDDALANSADRLAVLYVHPPLRAHREFLAGELRPKARATLGITHLPTGAQCFDARARLLTWPGFDAASAETAARRILQTPQMLDVALMQHRAFGPGRLVGVWRPNAAIARGESLLRHTHEDRHGRAIIAAVAAGALIDLALHREGYEATAAMERLRQELPWITQGTFAQLVERSAVEPLFWLTTFEGYRALAALRGEMPSDEFHDRMANLGALEPELIAEELESRGDDSPNSW